MRSAVPSQVLTVSTSSPLKRTQGTSLRRWKVTVSVPSSLVTDSHSVAIPGSSRLVSSLIWVKPMKVDSTIVMEVVSSAMAGSIVGMSPTPPVLTRRILGPSAAGGSVAGGSVGSGAEGSVTAGSGAAGSVAGAAGAQDARSTLRMTNTLSTRKFLRIFLLLTEIERV